MTNEPTPTENVEDPDEFLDWDRERDGRMRDFATDELPDLLPEDEYEGDEVTPDGV